MDSKVSALKVKLFADGADLQSMVQMAEKSYISGLTTNPTLMRKAGVENYLEFARKVLKEVTHKPISFEVFSDDLEEMKKQGLEISSWGDNVYVKVPITNTKGESTHNVVKFLSNNKVKVNVTAVMTFKQAEVMFEALNPDTPSYLSVFAGRIADTGIDPKPIISQCLELLSNKPSAQLIWASPRELLNIFQADAIGCHVITATNDILKKLELVGKDLNEFSLDTVKMFYDDAQASGFTI
jgi:transaldolase